MERIKNFFDNYNGTPQSDDYVLNGGKPMSDWVNRILILIYFSRFIN